MANFINTIAVLGDDVVVDSIIDRTITEFKDDTLASIGAGAFSNCVSLKSVNCPAVTEIRGVSSFSRCTSLEYADFPNLTTVAGTDVFDGCSALKQLNAPNLTKISNGLLRNCTVLESADFPLATSIEYRGLTAISSMTRMCFPKVETVAGSGIMMCPNLREIDLPSAKKLDNAALDRNAALVALILRSTVMCTANGANPVPGSPIASGTGYIYVPATLVDEYKAATNWSTFAAQFRALEDYTVDGTITGALDETKI